MNTGIDDGDGITFDSTTERLNDGQVAAAQRILREGSETDLKTCPVDVLRQISREEGLRYAKKHVKDQLVQQLMDYASNSLYYLVTPCSQCKQCVAQRWFNSEGDPLDKDGMIRPRTDTTADVARQLYESGTKNFMRKGLSLVQAKTICSVVLGLPIERKSSLEGLTDAIQKAVSGSLILRDSMAE